MNQREEHKSTPPVQETAQLEEIVDWLRRLIEEGKTTEAVVRFSRLRAPDQAEVILQLPKEHQAALLERLTARHVGAIMDELDPTEAVELSRELAPERLPEVLDRSSPDVAADVLRGLPEEVARRTLAGMEGADMVAALMGYEDDDAGGIMTPEYVALAEIMTVAHATAFLRRWAETHPDADPDTISYLFVVDPQGRLRGGVSLGRLVLAHPYQRVSLIMDRDVISVPPDADQETCARLMERYNISRLPVVDQEGRLIGVVWFPDAIEVVQEEATEDMYRMIGVHEQERALGPFWLSVRNRLPWLCINLGTALFAGFVVSLFESTLAKAALLATFLPVVAGQGGIAGTQSLTVIVRSMALGEVSPGNALRLLRKEVALGLVHGVAIGLLVGLVALLWKESPTLALVVAVAMLLNMIVAGLSGVLVPVGLRALRIDPALASSVVVTTATDVMGFFIYLGLATLALGRILAG